MVDADTAARHRKYDARVKPEGSGCAGSPAAEAGRFLCMGGRKHLPSAAPDATHSVDISPEMVVSFFGSTAGTRSIKRIATVSKNEKIAQKFPC
jgi:hypothetical protein